MEVDVNVNDHTSCAINHESNTEKDKNPLSRFRCAANKKTLIDISYKNDFFLIVPGETFSISVSSK